MANYNELTKSNWFEVEDLAAFKKELEEIGILSFFEFDSQGMCVLASHEMLYACDDDDNEFEYNDFLDLIQEHMKKGETVFVSSVGNEALRYLTAYCTIVTKEKIISRDFFRNISKEYNTEIF